MLRAVALRASGWLALVVLRRVLVEVIGDIWDVQVRWDATALPLNSCQCSMMAVSTGELDFAFDFCYDWWRRDSLHRWAVADGLWPTESFALTVAAGCLSR